MRYHNITHDDMLNGDGIRVVLWVAGCDHKCKNCQNSSTWDPEGGLIFGVKEREEIFTALQKDYISGITFTGGDPLHPSNRAEICELMQEIKTKFPTKTIWLYTGYKWEFIWPYVTAADVVVDGPFIMQYADTTYKWAGSTNQRVIDVKRSLEKEEVILHANN